MKIPFNKPYLSGKELDYIHNAIKDGHISGNGKYTKYCQSFFEEKWGYKKCLLTTSCTDALEMTAMLLDIRPGDEVIVPSYTFVSSALPFARLGAKIVFADSESVNPNMDAEKLESLITKLTKVIVVVHYAGVACNMDKIMSLASNHNLIIVEDAAQAIDSYYKGKPLGSIGHFGCFSFHETKNIQCGEGGMLALNDEQFIKRAEIIWEKGTDRAKFFRGEINKYGWVDIGSSFLPSDLLAAYLFAQLEKLDDIQNNRMTKWNRYYEQLKVLEVARHINLPKIDDFATNNAHMFYIICKNLTERTNLINHLHEKDILAVFHYQCLHKSTFMKNYSKKKPPELPVAEHYEKTLLRLPLYFELTDNEINYITQNILNFYG